MQGRYDLRDEVYRVEVPAAGASPYRTVTSLEEGIARICLWGRELPIVDRRVLSAGTTYFLAVAFDFVPPNATIAAAQRRAALPTGATAIGPTDPLFVDLATFSAPLSGGMASSVVRFRTATFTL